MTVAGNGVLGVFDGLSSSLQMLSYCISKVINVLSHLVGRSHGARSVVTAATDITRVTAMIFIIFY